jgi:hypothetical protein
LGSRATPSGQLGFERTPFARTASETFGEHGKLDITARKRLEDITAVR